MILTRACGIIALEQKQARVVSIRKEDVKMKQPSANKVYNAALYMRLSRDDENYGDSISIETQRTILRQYANEHSIHVVDEYVDDGWSGTNF